MTPYHIRKILVPVDLSETSLNALDTAVHLARQHDAALELLNVVENNFDHVTDESSVSISASNCSDVLTALAAAIEHAGNIKPIVIQQEGNVTETIVRHSMLVPSDLIVMGTHGASGFRNGFIGSNAYGVIKHAACPVLIIPPKRKFISFKKPLFPVRPVTGALVRFDVVSQFLSKNAFMDVLGLSYRMLEKESGILDKLIYEIEDGLQLSGTKARPAWNKSNIISEDVLQSAVENDSDLIVVTSALDVTTKPNFIGPHSQKIINCSRVPVLSVKKISVPFMA